METHDRSWSRPPKNPHLADDEVHVWRAILNLTSSQVKHLRDMLTADELARANRFHFEEDRRHFIVGRGVLRTILSNYLGVAPDQLHFIYNLYGKPFLATEFGDQRLNFNLSHSDGLALYAITRGREVGVDLERIRTNFEYGEIAERFFSSNEVAALRSIPAEMIPEAFFNCWTRKEAYIKAHGEGLSMPLGSFDVSLTPGEPAALLLTYDEPQETSRWSLKELRPGNGYVGALAVKGCDCRYKYWQWTILGA